LQKASAFYHWNDRQSLEQAVLVCKEVEIGLNEVERWSTSEGMIDKYKKFIERLKENETG